MTNLLENVGFKPCADCGRAKPLEDFPRSKGRSDGHGIYCKPCYSVRYRRHRQKKAAAEGRALRERVRLPLGTKHCPGCQGDLPVEAFGRNRSAADGLTSYCRPCHNAKGKETYVRLYGSSREYHLRRRYGIGQADVDRMLAEQDGVCPGCGKPGPEHVDHDHATGAVRGLLCFNCNQALGNVRDNAAVLSRLGDYLWAHQLKAVGLTSDESTLECCVVELLATHAG